MIKLVQLILISVSCLFFASCASFQTETGANVPNATNLPIDQTMPPASNANINLD